MPFLKDHNKTAVVFNGLQISYTEVLRNIGAFSNLYPEGNGIKIGIFSENRPEWIYSVYSAWHKGATPVIFDHTSEIDEIVFILNETAPQLIFCSQNCRNRLNIVLPLLSFSPEIIVFEDLTLKDNSVALSSETESLNEAGPLNKIDPLNEIAPLDMNKTALIVYTSGTTGSPKGVILSFNNLYANVQPILELAGKEDSTLAILPFYHVFPLLWTMIMPLYAGAAVVFVKSLDPGDIMQALQLNKVTAIVGVPKLFCLIREKILREIERSFWKKTVFMIAKKINSLWFSRIIFRQVRNKFGGNIRYLICGGAAIDNVVEEDFRTLGFEFQTGYGLTETSPMISFNRPGRIKVGSVGEPLECNQVRIVDEEITVRGLNVMLGYYKNGAVTSSVLKDGWFYTGDLGRLDEDGFLFVTGRKDDMIVLSNGKNIDPAKAEKAILSLSDLVKEAAVVKMGDKLCAFIYPDYSKFSCPHDMIKDEIKWKVITEYNKSVPDFRKITSFHLTEDELPKTSLGKIKRFKLIPPASAAIGKREISPDDSDQKVINPGKLVYSNDGIGVLANYFNKEKNVQAHLSSHIEIDIGLDSLDKVVLLSFIESSFGVILTEEELKHHATLRELIRYIRTIQENEASKETEWKKILNDTNNISIPKTWFTLSLLQFFFRLFFMLYCRVKIMGIGKIPPAPVIFASNQQSSLDEFIITCFLKRSVFLNTFYFAKEKHFRKPWKKFLAERHNTVLVDIEKDLKLSLQRLAACLKKDKNILIFPEGTRSLEGALGEFKPAYAVLSCALGIPVVPVIIKGSNGFLPKGSLIPRIFKGISVEFLSPVYPERMNSRELNELVNGLIKNNISAIETL